VIFSGLQILVNNQASDFDDVTSWRILESPLSFLLIFLVSRGLIAADCFRVMRGAQS
jgi:hypothetical protein